MNLYDSSLQHVGVVYLEDEVLPDGEGSDEEVVLLHVRRQRREAGPWDWPAVKRPLAAGRRCPERQRVQQRRFSSAARSQNRQQFPGMCDSTHYNDTIFRFRNFIRLQYLQLIKNSFN